MADDHGRKYAFPDIPIDPALTGKRRLSQSSPELSPRDALRDYRSDHLGAPLLSSGALSPDTQLRTPASMMASTGPSRSASGEDSLTLRRREANRLAAQRFRSRKKGYQDSLEEKVRQLEDERDALLRRLGEAPGVSTFGPPSSSGSRAHEELPFRSSPWQAGADGFRRPSFSSQSTSPERRENQDPELRIASLESANRHLQDELRTAVDENDRLRQELEGWRRWEHGQREDRDKFDMDRDRMSYTRTRSNLPIEDPHYASHSAPTQSGRNIPPPPLNRAQSFNYPHSSSYSSGFRLPPLRLPPQPAGNAHERDAPHSPSYLPRTPALDQPLRDPSPRRDPDEDTKTSR